MSLRAYHQGVTVSSHRLILIAVLLLSIVPTMRFIAWSRQAKANASYQVPETELAAVRRYIWLEALLFLAIPAFAAAMARGYGL